MLEGINLNTEMILRRRTMRVLISLIILVISIIMLGGKMRMGSGKREDKGDSGIAEEAEEVIGAEEGVPEGGGEAEGDGIMTLLKALSIRMKKRNKRQ